MRSGSWMTLPGRLGVRLLVTSTFSADAPNPISAGEIYSYSSHRLALRLQLQHAADGAAP